MTDTLTAKLAALEHIVPSAVRAYEIAQIVPANEDKILIDEFWRVLFELPVVYGSIA